MGGHAPSYSQNAMSYQESSVGSDDFIWDDVGSDVDAESAPLSRLIGQASFEETMGSTSESSFVDTTANDDRAASKSMSVRQFIKTPLGYAAKSRPASQEIHLSKEDSAGLVDAPSVDDTQPNDSVKADPHVVPMHKTIVVKCADLLQNDDRVDGEPHPEPSPADWQEEASIPNYGFSSSLKRGDRGPAPSRSPSRSPSSSKPLRPPWEPHRQVPLTGVRQRSPRSAQQIHGCASCIHRSFYNLNRNALERLLIDEVRRGMPAACIMAFLSAPQDAPATLDDLRIALHRFARHYHPST